MQLYCNQKPANSKFYTLTNIVKWALLVEIPLTIVVYCFFPSFRIKSIHYVVFISLQLLGIFIIAISTIEKIIQQYKPAIFYFLAVAMLVVTGIMATLQELGSIHYSTRTPNLLQIGFIVEIVLISFGMLYRYNQMKKENDLLGQELNELKFRSIRQMLEVQMKEQKRIAEDLHDLLGGQLAVIKMKINARAGSNKDNSSIVNLIDELSTTTRGIAHNMLPPALSEHALSDVIQSYVKELNLQQSIRFEFIQTGSIKQYNPEIEITLYKITLELIQNILKHSKATEAILQLFFKEDAIELNVEDNGVGIPSSPKKGMGFRNISSRLELFKGSMHVDTSPGFTIIIISIPLNTNK
jgi:signal transduction histidine kinase